MAESTSPSSIPRSSHRPLAYTSCIDTRPLSSTTMSACANVNTHSSFDRISQSREHEQSESKALPQQHRLLERDFCRLDLDSNRHAIEKTHKKLGRTESISLPTTPIEQISSSFDHACHPTLALQMNNTNSNNDEHFRLSSSTQQLTNELPSTTQSSSIGQSISSSTSSTTSETSIAITYGVDWSEQACSVSHCWFPFNTTDPSSTPPCSFFACKNPKPTLILALIRCESCLIVVHTHHLTNLRNSDLINSIPPCRASFSDVRENEQTHQYDRHFWSSISSLSKPCAYCKRKSASSSLFGINRPSTIAIVETRSNNSSPIPGNLQIPGTSSTGLQCSWCSRSYHRRCWEQAFSQDDKHKCDYGVYRNIIVRPRWIQRVSNTSSQFRAQYNPDDDDDYDNGSFYSPLLLFINKRSGGQSGEKIYRKLLRLLNPRQVFLLENDQTILHALEIYSSLSNVRICVFGGDGTVGWVLGRLAEIYPSLNNPPVCICPLGTGNDLSRVLSWGEQYDPKRLLTTFTQIPYAQVIALDRWQVIMEPLDTTNSNRNFNSERTFLSLFTHPKFIRDTNRASYQNHRTLPNTRFINYMSFGLDAAIALEFHDRRSRNPSKFSSPLKNKLMYINESRKYLNDFARSKMWSLSSYIRLICDGENLTDSIKNCHTLLVLNIPGYASGTNPWGKSSSTSSNNHSSLSSINIQKDSDSFEQFSTSSVDLTDLPANTHEVYEVITLNECSTDQSGSPSMTTATTINSTGRFERQDFGDRIIEVVGLSTTHMATIHIGFRGIRIAQCSQLRIELCCPMTAQMDGEPFYLPESVAVNISHAGQVLVLKNETR